MTIQSFIAKVNAVEPTVEQIMQHAEVDRSMANAMFEVVHIRYSPTGKALGLLDELIYCTTIGDTWIFNIDFHKEITLEQDIYRVFAQYNDHYEFGQRLSDQKIVLLDPYELTEEVLCNNIQEFLKFLCLLANFNTNASYSIVIDRHFSDEGRAPGY